MEAHVYHEMAERDIDSWYYYSKRAWLRIMLEKIPDPLSRVIDIGCGTGRNAIVLLPHLASDGEYIGIEPYRLKFDPPNTLKSRLIHRSIEQVRTDEVGDRADLVMLVDVLEHVEEWEAMAGVDRCLKEGGYLLLTVPASSYLWTSNDVDAHHLRRYTRTALFRLLSYHGYEVVTWNRYFSFAVFPLFLRSIGEKLVGIGKRESREGHFGPRQFDGFLRMFALFEAFLGRFVRLPFGTGIVCLARRKRQEPGDTSKIHGA